jgi:hypothetical protein
MKAAHVIVNAAPKSNEKEQEQESNIQKHRKAETISIKRNQED